MVVSVPIWVAIGIVVLGGAIWLYERAVERPRRRRDEEDRRNELF